MLAVAPGDLEACFLEALGRHLGWQIAEDPRVADYDLSDLLVECGRQAVLEQLETEQLGYGRSSARVKRPRPVNAGLSLPALA
jgi:hypothetical protein